LLHMARNWGESWVQTKEEVWGEGRERDPGEAARNEGINSEGGVKRGKGVPNVRKKKWEREGAALGSVPRIGPQVEKKARPG